MTRNKLAGCVVPALIVATLVAPMTAQAATKDTTWTAPRGICTQDVYRIKRYMPYAVRAARSHRLIRCVFNQIDPSQTREALAIAWRESRYDPFAYNAWSCATGLFQHICTLWPGRVKTWLRPVEFPNTWPRTSAFLARANAIVTARMVRSGGWSPWSTYP